MRNNKETTKAEIYAKSINVKSKYMWADCLIVLFSTLLAISSVFIGLLPLYDDYLCYKNILALFALCCCIIIATIVIIKMTILEKERKTIIVKEQYYKKRDLIASQVFSSIQNLQGDKVRLIFRHTYGCVHEWEPMNYRNNVLIYDVHEQIRSILVRIKDVIIQTKPEVFDNDNVRVDLIYCYPSEPESDPTEETKKDSSSKEIKVGDNNDSITGIWKIITSRDSSGTIHSLHELIQNPDSFFNLVYKRGYVFKNDKYAKTSSDLICNYIDEKKDREYTGFDGLGNVPMQGSAVGVCIEVRNDDPEAPLVVAILTINTYGYKLYDEEQDWFITENEYQGIFKDVLVKNFKSVLATELSQMYIRHAIRENAMCPITGRFFDKKNNNCHSSKCNPSTCSSLKKEVKSSIGID